MKVSVIIPIYKVEAFIERCATTLMEQTLREVEYIFVDDATPDGSIQVLEEVIARYPERKEQVHIVHHDTNKAYPPHATRDWHWPLENTYSTATAMTMWSIPYWRICIMPHKHRMPTSCGVTGT